MLSIREITEILDRRDILASASAPGMFPHCQHTRRGMLTEREIGQVELGTGNRVADDGALDGSHGAGSAAVRGRGHVLEEVASEPVQRPLYGLRTHVVCGQTVCGRASKGHPFLRRCDCFDCRRDSGPKRRKFNLKLASEKPKTARQLRVATSKVPNRAAFWRMSRNALFLWKFCAVTVSIVMQRLYQPIPSVRIRVH